MNRKEAEDFIYKSYLKASKLQDYNAKDSEKRHPELTRKIILSKAGTPCTLVTGSKGKGSVANMISQILQTRLNVGLMTSPHLLSFCERFKVNGVDISDDEFVNYISKIKPAIDEIDLSIPENICVSPMGIQAILGLNYFNDKHTDFNIFECGKGARYDDVNNIPHQYAVINSIFLEHTRELGETLEEIAENKSYVITGEQKALYTADQTPEVLRVIQNRTSEFGTPLKIYGRDFCAERIRYNVEGMLFDVNIGGVIYSDITIPLMGKHQARNCALAMALCLDILGTVDIDNVKEKLAETIWPGRMEVLSKDPFMMLDACINAASCANIKDVLNHLKIGEPIVIIGIPDDKDYKGVIREMAEVSKHIILTKSRNPHYSFSETQCNEMKKEGIETCWSDSIDDAIRQAKSAKKPTVILGTTSLVSEVKQFFSSNSVHSQGKFWQY